MSGCWFYMPFHKYSMIHTVSEYIFNTILHGDTICVLVRDQSLSCPGSTWTMTQSYKHCYIDNILKLMSAQLLLQFQSSKYAQQVRPFQQPALRHHQRVILIDSFALMGNFVKNNFVKTQASDSDCGDEEDTCMFPCIHNWGPRKNNEPNKSNHGGSPW